MYCKKCGKELKEGHKYCSRCGSNMQTSFNEEYEIEENNKILLIDKIVLLISIFITIASFIGFNVIIPIICLTLCFISFIMMIIIYKRKRNKIELFLSIYNISLIILNFSILMVYCLTQK